MTSEPNTHFDRVTRSMLWAAWADALGFITERTTRQYLEKRVGAQTVTATVEWTRRVGGKFGVEMVLPAGTYSDDTQLRLASSRAISGSGFDPEAFAKVDLAVWPSYALGSGQASRAAATNIARATVPWFGNFFDGYLFAGGNGAAMRIQPHVWAASNPTADPRFLIDVLRDAVITHGHPRALVGAVLHAIALSKPMSSGKPLTVEDWPEIIAKTQSAAALVESDENLATVWLPLWEKSASKSFPDSWSDTVEECAQMLDAVRDGVSELQKEARPQTYDQMATILDLRNPDNVGSGTATAVIALAVATAIPDPRAASRLVANALGTDTDTIGTMVGAITGASATTAPDSPVQDSDYLHLEAARLADIAAQRKTVGFNYADLLTWVAPKSQIDCVGLVQGQMALAGLAFLQPDPELKAGESKQATWEWTVSDFGQSFLVKRRFKLKELSTGQQPAKERFVTTPSTAAVQAIAVEAQAERLPMPPRPSRSDHRPTNHTAQPPVPRNRADLSVDQILRWLQENGSDDQAVGLAARRVAESGTVEQMIAFGVALRSIVRDHRA